MAEHIRWGILSTARIGETRVIPAIKASHNGRVVAVASRTHERAAAFAQQNDIPTAYGSYDELIAAPDVDAIYIPIPNSEHAAWSIKAAEAGKPVLCEKPLASNAAEAQTMVDAFAARGLLFAEAFMYRFHPQTVRVKALLNEGAVGDLQIVSAAFTFAIRNEADIRLRADLAGGALMDVGCYCVNVMRHMTGEEPATLRAVARFGAASGVDEIISGAMQFPSGAIGHFDAGLRASRAHTYEIRGTKGRIVVDQGFVPHENDTVIQVWQGDDKSEISIPTANSYTLMVEDFADALLNGRAPQYPPSDAVANMRAIDALLASARG
ncbi:MAG: Gfo/Idh/MocA family oxidoreductase [Chloroflexota bacterium]|nr:Gfo/Idh/MocA family oxidoreductase [Chloroflexota bacterium]